MLIISCHKNRNYMSNLIVCPCCWHWSNLLYSFLMNCTTRTIARSQLKNRVLFDPFWSLISHCLAFLLELINLSPLPWRLRVIFWVCLLHWCFFSSYFLLRLVTFPPITPSSELRLISHCEAKCRSSCADALVTSSNHSEFILALECCSSNPPVPGSQFLCFPSTILFFRWPPRSLYWLFSSALAPIIEQALPSRFSFQSDVDRFIFLCCLPLDCFLIFCRCS